MPNRRTILKAGLLGSVVLAFGGVGLALRPGQLRTPSRALLCLDERGFSTLSAAADVLVPGGQGFPLPADVALAEQVDAVLATLHPAVQKEVKQVLALLENAFAGLIIDGRVECFSSCDLPTRERVLTSWQTARNPLLRTAFKALHGFCSGAYWTSPSVMARAGYPGPQPWLLEARAQMRTAP
jgi:hypothetical protein